MPNSIYHHINQAGPFLKVTNTPNKKECYIDASSIVSFEQRLHPNQTEYIHLELTNGAHVELCGVRLNDLFYHVMEARSFS